MDSYLFQRTISSNIDGEVIDMSIPSAKNIWVVTIPQLQQCKLSHLIMQKHPISL